jgi:hypothetical protein
MLISVCTTTARRGFVEYQAKMLASQIMPGHELEWVLTVSGFTNHFWNGLTTNELITLLITDIKYTASHSGLWQFGGQRVSKYELLNLIAKVYKLDIDIEPKETPEVNKCLLSNGLVFIKPLERQLEEMRQDELRWVS